MGKASVGVYAGVLIAFAYTLWKPDAALAMAGGFGVFAIQFAAVVILACTPIYLAVLGITALRNRR